MTDDLLADVFPDTEDAPLPVESRDCGGNLLSLWASPKDPRWTVDLWFYPDGKLGRVNSVKARRAEVPADARGVSSHAPRASEPSTAVSGPGNGIGGER